MNSLILALNLTAVSLAGAAETHQQNSWSPWFGCWQAEGAPAGEVMCIAPTQTGVRISTLVNGAVKDESDVSADGLARRIGQQGCTGSERARWSSDRRRVFLDSDVTCNASDRRVVKGMFAFVAPNEWISVQTATRGDSVAMRVVRFVAADTRQAGGMAASFASGSAITDAMLAIEEGDVAEAVEHLGAPAVQEWMREAGEPFQLGYQAQQGRSNGSALDQVGSFSNPEAVREVEPVREVVRIVERPVYVHDYYDYGYYSWHYSPWGYRYHGWHWYHRPVIYIGLPIYIGRNHHYRHDYYRYRHRGYDNWRYGRNDDGRDNRGNGGRVTRDGYSSGRARDRDESTVVQPERTQRSTTTVSRVRTAQPRERSSDESRERSGARSQGSRESSGTVRSSSSGSRSSAGSSNSSGSRTARARGSSPR